MPTDPDLVTVAALIGEPTRAAMLLELMGGRALTATELATRAEVAPSTASDHLAKLVRGGLLVCVAQGRHRYFRLASADVARVIESLGVLGHRTDRPVHIDREIEASLRFARTCYDHLAGQLGVAIADALTERRILQPDGESYRVTQAGDIWLAEFGLDLVAARRTRRAFARACLDWTERRPHLAGALGTALLDQLARRGWTERLEGERAVHLTPRGEHGLRTGLGVQIGPATVAALG